MLRELEAIQAIGDVVSALTPPERHRVAAWLAAYAEDGEVPAAPPSDFATRAIEAPAPVQMPTPVVSMSETAISEDGAHGEEGTWEDDGWDDLGPVLAEPSDPDPVEAALAELADWEPVEPALAEPSDADPVEAAPADQPDQEPPDPRESFEALFAAVAPKTNGQKAVVAAWWLERYDGLESWTTRDVNKQLQTLGMHVPSLSIVLSNETKAKGPKVAMLDKQGASIQARKSFVLTQAGVDYVETCL